MGRKAGALYINPKKFGGVTKPCMIEMVSFLNCLALNKQNDDKCVRQKDLLVACAQAQVIIQIIFLSLQIVYSKHFFILKSDSCLWHDLRKEGQRMQQRPSITIFSDLHETRAFSSGNMESLLIMMFVALMIWSRNAMAYL